MSDSVERCGARVGNKTCRRPVGHETDDRLGGHLVGGSLGHWLGEESEPMPLIDQFHALCLRELRERASASAENITSRWIAWLINRALKQNWLEHQSHRRDLEILLSASAAMHNKTLFLDARGIPDEEAPIDPWLDVACDALREKQLTRVLDIFFEHAKPTDDLLKQLETWLIGH